MTSLTSSSSSSVVVPTLRVARPTNDIKLLLPFYTTGLGLDVLYEFKNHDGFDGVMLGHPNWPYHFEFTTHIGHDAGRAPTQDNLIVFYIPERRVWEGAVTRMVEAGFESVTSFNPYWDRQGMTFEDPDGYRIVLQWGKWDI